jgi:FRG domain
MPPPTELVVSNLNEFLDATFTIGSASSTGMLWYRGAQDFSHGLVPRLYRSTRDAGELLGVEQEMLAQFRSRSRPFLGSDTNTEWGYLFIMQHYGVPTRLLDWSENAFVALYFALSLAADTGFETDAAVWVLDPCAWNAATLPGMSAPGKALHAESTSLANYAPNRELTNMAAGSVAMYAPYNNPRITAQRGVFTVFGCRKSTMDETFETSNFDENVLTRLRIPKDVLAELYGHLRTLGFRESMIYPDLAGLAIEVRTDQGLS